MSPAQARVDPFQRAEAARSEIGEDQRLELYRLMLRSRRAEERAADLVEAKEIRCPVHLYLGQEAIAAGVCAALEKSDYIFGTHRSHGHYISKGSDLNALFAEFYGKETGCARGRGGSMHVIDTERGILGTTPIVAASIPMAVGAGLASKMKKDSRVSVAFFGDGATEEGVFHESMNLAAVWNLPVVFVCENNFFSSHLHLSARRRTDNLVEQAKPYAIPAARIDGNSALEVHAHARLAVEHARSGGGPSFLECRTYRWRGHVGPAWEWNLGIRDPEEVREWIARCPIEALGKELIQGGVVDASDLARMREEIDEEIASAVSFARASAYPTLEESSRNVFVEAPQRPCER